MSVYAEHEELARRVRSLTSVLHEFMLQKSPSRQRKDISPFLRHFTTLLTCGDKYDKEAKKVVAVAGSIAPKQQPRALIVSQNLYLASSVEKIRLTVVNKDNRSLEEVVTGFPNPDLIDHIADVLTALSAFNPRAIDHLDQKAALEVFFLSRSWRKFAVRFKEDSRLCGGKRLYEVISQWRPDPGLHEVARKWVNPPGWLLRLHNIPKMKSREIEGQLQWEFSDETKHAWSMILAAILLAVDRGIENVKAAKGKTGKKTEEVVRREMNDLNRRTGCLYFFVCWQAGVVRSLLTETDMVSSIATVFMPMGDATSDDLTDLYREPEESKGEQVFRYLRMVTAWHAAVNDLCLNPTLSEFLNNVAVGLVEVPPSPSSVLSLEDVCDEFFSRFPDMLENNQEVTGLIGTRYSEFFSGCVHAEATLMGLLNYYNPSSAHTSPTLYAELQDPGTLQQIVQPVAEAGNTVIAVSKKCCWCCDWLGRNLETEFTLPGTHGIMFPWDPPKLGVSVSVLEKLEKELWKELHQAVFNSLEFSYSRHSSPLGSPAMPPSSREDVEESFLFQELEDLYSP